MTIKDEKMFKLNPGDDCWVVERDEDGEPYDVTCFMFLARVNDYVVLSPFINYFKDIDGTMAYLAQETREEYGAKVSIFPMSDCFSGKEEAENALNATSVDD